MLTMEAMRRLRDAYAPYPRVTVDAVMDEIGHPTREAIIETALAGMNSPDRNVRVLMLRVLAAQSGEAAAEGILAGLGDPKRRVRLVAIRSSRNYLSFPQITARLEAIVTDEAEKRKIREQALGVLAGQRDALVDDLSETAAGALKTLAQTGKYRWQILFNLTRLDLTSPVENLLKAFVADGSKAEAIMATRALCGFRVVHIDQFEGDEAARRHIVQSCELAAGRMFYWVPRAEYDRLLGRQTG